MNIIQSSTDQTNNTGYVLGCTSVTKLTKSNTYIYSIIQSVSTDDGNTNFYPAIYKYDSDSNTKELIWGTDTDTQITKYEVENKTNTQVPDTISPMAISSNENDQIVILFGTFYDNDMEYAASVNVFDGVGNIFIGTIENNNIVIRDVTTPRCYNHILDSITYLESGIFLVTYHEYGESHKGYFFEIDYDVLIKDKSVDTRGVVPPLDHSSVEPKFGIGTTEKYGHTTVSDIVSDELLFIRKMLPEPLGQYSSCIYADQRYIIQSFDESTNTTKVFYSFNLTDWHVLDIGIESRGLVYRNGIYLSANTNSYQVSTDLVNWSDYIYPTTEPIDDDIPLPVSTHDFFFVVINSKSYISYDGISWYNHPELDYCYYLGYGEDYYYNPTEYYFNYDTLNVVSYPDYRIMDDHGNYNSLEEFINMGMNVIELPFNVVDRDKVYFIGNQIVNYGANDDYLYTFNVRTEKFFSTKLRYTGIGSKYSDYIGKINDSILVFQENGRTLYTDLDFYSLSGTIEPPQLNSEYCFVINNVVIGINPFSTAYEITGIDVPVASANAGVSLSPVAVYDYTANKINKLDDKVTELIKQKADITHHFRPWDEYDLGGVADSGLHGHTRISDVEYNLLPLAIKYSLPVPNVTAVTSNQNKVIILDDDNKKCAKIEPSGFRYINFYISDEVCDLPSNYTYSSIFSEIVNDTEVIICVASPSIVYSTDGGETWNETLVDSGQTIVGIIYDSQNSRYVLATKNYRLYTSTDLASWTYVSTMNYYANAETLQKFYYIAEKKIYVGIGDICSTVCSKSTLNSWKVNPLNQVGTSAYTVRVSALVWSEQEQSLYVSCWNNDVFYAKINDDGSFKWSKLNPDSKSTRYGILTSDQYIMTISNNGHVDAKYVNSIDNTHHTLYTNDGYVIVEGGFVKVWNSDLGEYLYCIVYNGFISCFALTLSNESYGVAATPKMVVDYVGRQLTVVDNTIHPKLVTVPANFADTVTIPVKSGTIFKTTIGTDKLVLIDAPDYEYYEFTLFLVNAGRFNVTFQDNVVFSNGFTPIFTSSGIDILKFLTIDGGETWYCKQDGQHVH